MKIGELVRRKPTWGEWVIHNPWMLTAKDCQIGIIVALGRRAADRQVLWPGYIEWHSIDELESADADR